uniref:Uncharacterized protein n=1 Tax=Arion vulgaris TaxID=1028688 RepID=A0A0B6Z8D8_9EUPU
MLLLVSDLYFSKHSGCEHGEQERGRANAHMDNTQVIPPVEQTKSRGERRGERPNQMCRKTGMPSRGLNPV